MKGFKEKTTGLKWETIVWRGHKFRVPLIDDRKLFHKRSDIQRFSKFKDSVVKMFVDFCKEYDFSIYLVESDVHLLQAIKLEDVTELAKKYQSASLATADENIYIVNEDRSFYGIGSEYPMYLNNYDANTGEELTDYIVAFDTRPLRTLASRAVACHSS